MSDYSTIYKNLDAKSMMKWRDKDADPYKNLIRNSQQLLFLHKYMNLKKKRVILEYGCAFADLPAMIKTMNPRHELYGVEIVKKIAEIAKFRLGRKNVFAQSCEKNIPLKSDSFDLIFSFDMVEHVASKKKIRQMLKECNRLLKKDGICIIVTPNCSQIMKFIYLITGNKWLIDKKFHPNQYNRKMLEKEINSHLKLMKTKKGYDLNLFTKLLSWLGVYKHICVITGKK